jgi:hypothetical protein
MLGILILGQGFVAFATGVAPESQEGATYMGNYIEGGTLLDGKQTKTKYPHLDYEFKNIQGLEYDEENEINASHVSEDLVMRSGSYSFDVEVGDDLCLFHLSDPEGGEYTTFTRTDGSVMYGYTTLKPIKQELFVRFTVDQEVERCMDIEFDLEYEYTFKPNDGSKDIVGTIVYDERITPTLSDSGHSDLGWETLDLWKKLDDPILILTGMVQNNFEKIDENGNELDFYVDVVTIPFIIEEGRVVHAFMGGDPDDSMGMGGAPSAPVNQNPTGNTSTTADKVLGVLAVSSVAAGAAMLGSGATNGVSTSGGLVDTLQKRFEEEKTFYEVELNGGVDLPDVVLEMDKTVEIPIRVLGGEEENWFFIGKSILENNHKRKIPTIATPALKGSGLLSLKFTGDEIVKDDTVQITVLGFNAKKVSQVVEGIFEFELVLGDDASEEKDSL